jgi:hypothetical protein
MALTDAEIAKLPEALRRKYQTEKTALAQPAKPEPSAPVETPPAAQPQLVIHNPDLRQPEPPASTQAQEPEPSTPPAQAQDPWEQKARVLAGKIRSEFGITPYINEHLGWEQNYALIQERYNNEARLKAMSKQLVDAQTVMKFQAEALNTLKDFQAKVTPKAPEPPKPVPQATIKPLNLEDYDHLEDEAKELAKRFNQVIELVSQQQGTMAQQQEVIRQLQGKTETLSMSTDRVAKDFGATQHQQFISALEGAVPDCWTLNENPDFRDWLDQPVPMEVIGPNGQLMEKTMKRDDILQAAQNSRNVGRIQKLFNEFKTQTGYRAPSNGGRPSPDLFIEPDTAGRGATPLTKPKQEPVTREQLDAAAKRARIERTPEAINAFNKLSSQYQGSSG